MTPSDCLATYVPSERVDQSEVLVTSDGGKTWAPAAAQGLQTSLLSSTACATSSYCWASGAAMPPGSTNPVKLDTLHALLTTTDDQGATWKTANSIHLSTSRWLTRSRAQQQRRASHSGTRAHSRVDPPAPSSSCHTGAEMGGAQAPVIRLRCPDIRRLRSVRRGRRSRRRTPGAEGSRRTRLSSASCTTRCAPCSAR